jgi:hypothetical protein
MRCRTSRIQSMLSLVFGTAAALAASSAASTETQRVGCVDAWGEARYTNYGYDHIVHLRSRCRTRMLCDVSTNVNPRATRVSIPAGESLEVLTFRGSPAREFTPNVRCNLPGRSNQSAVAFARRPAVESR